MNYLHKYFIYACLLIIIIFINIRFNSLPSNVKTNYDFTKMEAEIDSLNVSIISLRKVTSKRNDTIFKLLESINKIDVYLDYQKTKKEKLDRSFRNDVSLLSTFSIDSLKLIALKN